MEWQPRADHGRKHDTGEEAPNTGLGIGRGGWQRPRSRSAALRRRAPCHSLIEVKHMILLRTKLFDFTSPITEANVLRPRHARLVIHSAHTLAAYVIECLAGN